MTNNPFLPEKRLFIAIHNYIELVMPLTIRAFRGATRLYLMTGLGVSLAAIGELDQLKTSLAKDGVLLEPPLAHVQVAISANCALYAKLLSGIILRRIATRGTQDIAADGGTRPRLSYNITPFLAHEIDRLVATELRDRQTWGPATMWQNLATIASIEYSHVASMGGVQLTNPRQDGILRGLLNNIMDRFADGDILGYDPRTYHLPILTVLLVIARLLYADFRENFITPPTVPLMDRLWISDSTLAALPWPSIGFVAGFHEPDAGLISTAGWRYLHHIALVYPDHITIAA